MDLEYDVHAVRRMRQRHIFHAQVEYVLEHYTTQYPAEKRQYLSYRAIVYLAEVDGRSLKVYVRAGSEPPYVLTAAWKDDEG